MRFMNKHKVIPCFMKCVVAGFTLFLLGFSFVSHYPDPSFPWWKWPMPYAVSPDETVIISEESSTFKIEEDRRIELDEEKSTKIVMFNNPPFGNDQPISTDENRCGGKCTFTYDTRYRDVADAVIYHCIEMYSDSTTFSRKIDSDIYMPYSTASTTWKLVMEDNLVNDIEELMKMKKKHTLWMVGNCMLLKGSSHRMWMVKNLLSSGLQADLRGSCFTPLPDNSPDVVLRFLSQYKFYLSFENAFHCRDYITEKVWYNALRAGVVPVIWGPTKLQAKQLLPERSYIHAEDYKTPADLVEYLDYLNTNETAYREYFKWRMKPPATTILNRKSKPHGSKWTSDIYGYCELCMMLHEGQDASESRVVHSIDDWWYGSESQDCLVDLSTFEYIRAYMMHLSLLLPSKIKILDNPIRDPLVLFLLILFFMWLKSFKLSVPRSRRITRLPADYAT